MNAAVKEANTFLMNFVLVSAKKGWGWDECPLYCNFRWWLGSNFIV